MERQRALWFFISILILTSLACNAFAGQVEPGAPPPPTAVTDALLTPDSTQLLAPTATLPGEDAAEGTAVAPGTPSVTVLVDLNVRSGPGVQYSRVGFLLEGAVVPILGVDPLTGWWKVDCPPTAEGDACWISGGAQYVRAAGAEAVPTALAPPTPTPVPPSLGPGQGVLAYIDNGRLYAAYLDLTQNPPTVGQPRQLSEVGNVQQVALAPDGRRVAFVAGTSQANALSVVNVDGQGERMLAISTDLPVEAVSNPTGFAVLIDQVQWLADAQTIAFNTAFVNLTGPGAGSQVDLWTIGPDDDAPLARFPAGAGTGYVALSMRNTVLLSQAGQLARINLDGSAGQIMVQFTNINTASEYVYYPQPQWTPANGAFVAIPDADPWSAGSGAALWQIPEQGAAVLLGRIDGNVLFNPVVWTQDGSRLAYVQNLMDLAAPAPMLLLANANGQNPIMVSEALQVRFLGWSPSGADFLFAARDFWALGRVDGAQTPFGLAPGQVAGGAQWVSDSAAIVALGFPESNTWRLVSLNTAGVALELLNLSGNEALFDAWAP